jgi:2-polyprenyl-3-methyl-5-hydroxy-6-metoxy-1,4-benzoquinol methylase
MDDARSEIEKFDDVADRYSDLHSQAVGASGEPVGYFAQYKIDRMKRLGVPAAGAVLDYGCGIGNLTELLVKDFASVTGYDPSAVSVEVARQRIPGATFFDDSTKVAEGDFDAAVLAGVLHHVPVNDRVDVIKDALTKIKPGGAVVVFEHNPYNPLTRRAVDMCAFDDDAILLRPKEVRQLMRDAGAASVTQDYIVFFPRPLSGLRPLEPALRLLPLGAQTMTVARR